MTHHAYDHAMRILLIEPYFGGSHRVWAEGYRTHSSHEVTLITLPARWWRWRMRGGAVSVAERARELADEGYRPDAVLVSSMIDLGLLRSLLDGVWGRVPTALYFHESQLSYPDSPQLEPDASYGFTNWTSAMVADRVFFNSGYHLDVFFEQVDRQLRGFPDLRHLHHIEGVRSKSSVLPVGIDLSWLAERQAATGPPLVLWNHRWEHDKAPEVFFDAARRLAADGLEFDLAICGESFRQVPEEFLAAACDLGGRMVQFGFAPLRDYRRLLLSSEVVVSTSLQEFFGISVMEAVAAGAFPVLPDRLSYPHLIPQRFHGRVLYADGELRRALERAITEDHATASVALAAHARSFGWDRVAVDYDREIGELL